MYERDDSLCVKGSKMGQYQKLGLIVSTILFFGGFLDLGVQYFSQGGVHWRIPLFLIGTGSGLSLFILPFYTPQEKELEEEYNEDDLSGMYKNDIGVFRNSSGDNNSSGINNNSDSFGSGGGGD